MDDISVVVALCKKRQLWALFSYEQEESPVMAAIYQRCGTWYNVSILGPELCLGWVLMSILDSIMKEALSQSRYAIYSRYNFQSLYLFLDREDASILRNRSSPSPETGEECSLIVLRVSCW